MPGRAPGEPPPQATSSAKPALPPPPVPIEFPESPDLKVQEIRRRLMSDDLHQVWLACRAIEDIGDPREKRELLLEQLKCKTPFWRSNALYKLKHASDDGIPDLLLESLRTDPSADVRKSAAMLMGEPGGEGHLEALLKAFHEDEFQVKLAAAVSLHQLGHSGPMVELLPRLGADLESPDGGIRREAAERLGSFMNPAVLPFLARAVGDANSDVRNAVARSLGELGVPEVIPLLETLVQDPRPEVAETARETLKRLRSAPPK